jgi:tRNA pseudouridine38-40 synthase
MHRYFIELAYKGTNYHGWQEQNNASSVQEKLNQAISILTRQPAETMGCGRTDAGVHASQFYAHIDFSEPLESTQEFSRRINAILPSDIFIFDTHPVDNNAHARFDATSRSYSYYISKKKNIFQPDHVWFCPVSLNIVAMQELSNLLLNHTDYGCFSKAGGQQFTNLCTITEAKWVEHETGFQFKISANRFLRGMVRAIVGTLLEAGKNKLSKDEFVHILNSGDRKLAGHAVPAHALFLEQITYPYLSHPAQSPFKI